ncbi:variant surface glycoprotein VSG [Trypanosoma brucei equiperdum]|uniref:Variant surface glycoprotein VSG n=1 Tax=Trypanosoma brucei equiperdum TaxID=630700 RepID=A0A3L6KYN8_9TRYP|nr:variant surface glycoprotein VSG [Trypanosoma brucei equiperdum]
MFQTTLIAAITVALSTNSCQATAGDSTKEFAVMCHLFHACKQGIPAVGDENEPSLQPEIQTLVGINMSAADDEFYGSNFEEEKGHEADKNYTQHKATWAQLKKDLETNQVSKQGIKITRLPKSSIRHYVQLTALSGLEALETAKAPLPDAKTAEEINDELKEVLYGSGNKQAVSGIDKTFGNTPADACGDQGGATSKAGISLANDFVCLCGGGSTAAAGCIGGNGAFTAAGNGSSGTGAAAIAELLGKCHNKQKQPTAPGELESLITTYNSLIGAQAGNTAGAQHNYSKHSAARCSAGDQEGCINYKYQIDTNNAGIPWQNKLKQVIDDMRQRRARHEAIKRLIEKAKETERQVLIAYIQSQAVTDLAKPTNAA